MKIHKGDRVEVISGKDRGRQGNVMRVMPKVEKIIVEGVNTAKKHQKATRTTMQGGIIDKDMPIHVSNVMIVCNQCGPVRVGHVISDDGLKTRVCKSCGAEL
jgi:large subunit ribosomal protein L24